MKSVHVTGLIGRRNSGLARCAGIDFGVSPTLVSTKAADRKAGAKIVSTKEMKEILSDDRLVATEAKAKPKASAKAKAEAKAAAERESTSQ